MAYKDLVQSKGTPTNVSIGNTFREELKNPELSEDIPDSLYQIEEQIKKLVGKTYENAWHIGKRLIAIDKKFIIQAGYTNISDYAREKFGFTGRTAYNFMFMATNFSKSQALSIGSKLYLLSSLEQKKVPKYVAWIEAENPSYRQIQDKLRQDFPPVGKPKQDININRSRITVDLRRMKSYIPKLKQESFLEELKNLIKKYSE